MTLCVNRLIRETNKGERNSQERDQGMKFRQTEPGETLAIKSIIIVVFISLIILASSCTKDKSTIQHFNKSINYANQSTRIINIGGSFELIGQEDIEKIVEFRKKALEEARLVDIEKLNRHYPDLGNHYRDEFIKGLELFIEGFEKHDTIKLLAGQMLDEKFEVWLEQNIDAIRKR